jgi:hypothetical protein
MKLAHVMIYWTEDSPQRDPWFEATRGQILICRHGTPNDATRGGWAHVVRGSSLTLPDATAEATARDLAARLYQIVAGYGVDPTLAHRQAMKVREYRDYIGEHFTDEPWRLHSVTAA